MFGKTNLTNSQNIVEQRGVQPAEEKITPETQRAQHSFIGKGARLTGDLVSTGDVTFEGALDGKINCRSLTLSGSPSISGSVDAETVHVCGSFEGELRARKVVLTKTASMIGNIFHEILEIHPGAIFEGQVSRQPNRQSNDVQKQVEAVSRIDSVDGQTGTGAS